MSVIHFLASLFESVPHVFQMQVQHECVSPHRVLELLRQTTVPPPGMCDELTMESVIGLVGAELRRLDDLLKRERGT